MKNAGYLFLIAIAAVLPIIVYSQSSAIENAKQKI